MNHIWLKRIALASLTLSLAAVASAQYIWLDESGVKQYSDAPPPTSVPKNRILKEPGTRSKAETDSVSESGKGANSETAAPPTTWAEKNAAFQKRRAEQAKKDAKAAEEEKLAADKAKNCENASNQQQILSTGQAIFRLDKNGQRTFVTEEQRQKELQETNKALDNCK
jgi:hypothetical protein